MVQTATTVHPVLESLTAIDLALADVAEVDPMFLATPDKRSALVQVCAAEQRLQELKLRLLAAADDVAEAEGARDAGAWLARRTRQDPVEGRRQLRLARALEAHPVAASALREGSASVAQVITVLRAVAELPADLDPAVRARAEGHLLAQAADFTPSQLRVLGRRVLQVVDPDADDDHERRLLEREEAEASRRTYLRTRRNGDGTTEIRMRLPDLASARLMTYLHAFTSPRRGGVEAGAVTVDRRPYDEQLGAAFGAFLEAVDPDRLPLHGGDATTVVVTVPLETLRTGLGTATVGDTPMSPGQVRRLACTAGVIPAVLGGASQVLDLGRTRRLFSGAQRKALSLRQPTCRAEGCDIPAAWCEAHHAGSPWAAGGRTDLADGLLLCSHHHHRAHDRRYEMARCRGDGGGERVRFHRRC